MRGAHGARSRGAASAIAVRHVRHRHRLRHRAAVHTARRERKAAVREREKRDQHDGYAADRATVHVPCHSTTAALNDTVDLHQHRGIDHRATFLRRNALLTTDTELSAIAAPAKIGERSKPDTG